MEDELKNNPITDSQNGVVVDDEDDDTPTLSSETLAALKEFLAEQNGPPVNAEPEEKEKEVALVTEDWRLGQFWYDRDTAETVAHEVLTLRWSQLVPMLPVENCDNVFQTVYGLLPGYHQDVNHNLQIHSSLVRRLSLEKVMEGHQGCVNAVAWNSKGSLLISGSDDTRTLVLVIDVGVKEIEGWTARLLPSRQFGYNVLTSAGIMDHEEARRKNVGGKVLGFFTRLNFKSDL